jgi:hypothetical protein
MTKNFVDGDIVSCVATFQDQAFDEVDPDSVVFMYEVDSAAALSIPYSGATEPASGVVARNSLGVFEYWLDTTGRPGSYKVQAKGTGQGQATTPIRYFQVGSRLA